MPHVSGCLQRTHALFLASAVALLVVAVARGPAILAPADSTITLSAATTTISLSGSATITATVVAASGSAFSEGLQTVIDGHLSVTLTTNSTTPSVNTAVRFTATPAITGPTIDRYERNVGDSAGGSGNTRTTTIGQASYTCTTAGSKTIAVKAVAADGSSATSQITIVVQ
jgi:hypothetical protein